MADNDMFGPELADRASSPALSDVSQLTVLSRSPSPVPDYQGCPRQIDVTLPFTPPSTPGRSRASDGRFAPRYAKRQSYADTSSPSKKPRSLREPTSLGSPTAPRSPRSPRSTRRLFGDAVSSPKKCVLPVAIPWVVGKGGYGILEALPKEIRQKIYGFTFGIDTPVTIRECCGPGTTVRERQACWKHGSRAASEHGRFNILQVSKAMRIEASWVTLSQGLLILKVGEKLTWYLGYYRWNCQRRSPAVQVEHGRKAIMWASVGQYRQVRIDLREAASSWDNPVSYTKSLVEAASSLCQSWGYNSSSENVATDAESRHTIQVCIGSLFNNVTPFNGNSTNSRDGRGLVMYIMVHSLLHSGEPDFDKMAADSGNNLMRLIAVIAKYRGLSQWKFIVDTQLHERDEGGLEWLRTFQAECAKYDMLLENGSCESNLGCQADWPAS